jgi:hypothetical protein
MIAPQSPTLQIFITAQPMSRCDVPSQCLAAIAAIQANDIIVLHGSPHRYSRDTSFLWLNGLSKLTERLVNCGNQVSKLLWSHRVVANVAGDDHSRGMWVGLFGIHDHAFALSWLTIM